MARVPVSVLGVLSFVAVSGVAGLCEAHGAQAAAQQASDRVNIRLGRVLVGVFEDLLASSPTFRAQCARITLTPYVRVTVVPALAKGMVSQGRARTDMRRYSSGALVATVEIPVPLTMSEYAELLGHEFEHIIEQIEHVNLAALALARGGASRLVDGAYETTRAQRAGLMISGEHDSGSAAGPLSAGYTQPLPVSPRVLPVQRLPRSSHDQQ